MKEEVGGSTAHVRKLFPGSNSAYGFHSFYDEIIDDDAARIFVIKGGPGVGKSTFMSSIGEKLWKMGYDLELHCCSSDNDSLDGIVIPQLDIACIDGTAPHIVDPKNPGVVDEIVHLGDYWNEEGMIVYRDAVLQTNREITRLFRRAYNYLGAAKMFLEEVEGFYRENGALHMDGLNRVALQLIDEIFGGKIIEWFDSSRQRRQRHLFATAITPAGPISYLDTLIAKVPQKYIIKGDDGTGKNELIARLKDAARMHGFFVEVFHCALDPQKIDHVIIPELGVAVLNSVTPHILFPGPGDKVIETDSYTRDPGSEKKHEREVAREMYHRSMEEAVSFILRAKKLHDELEAYYIPNMSFGKINEVRDSVMEKILSYA